MDPRVKPEGDRKESVLESDNFYKVMPRFGTNRPGIFELMKKKIGRSLEFFALQKIGMTKDRIIGRSLDVFWRKRGMTSLKNWRGGMVVLLSRLFCTSIEVALSGVEDF